MPTISGTRWRSTRGETLTVDVIRDGRLGCVVGLYPRARGRDTSIPATTCGSATLRQIEVAGAQGCGIGRGRSITKRNSRSRRPGRPTPRPRRSTTKRSCGRRKRREPQPARPWQSSATSCSRRWKRRDSSTSKLHRDRSQRGRLVLIGESRLIRYSQRKSRQQRSRRFFFARTLARGLRIQIHDQPAPSPSHPVSRPICICVALLTPWALAK